MWENRRSRSVYVVEGHGPRMPMIDDADRCNPEGGAL